MLKATTNVPRSPPVPGELRAVPGLWQPVDLELYRASDIVVSKRIDNIEIYSPELSRRETLSAQRFHLREG